MSNSVQRYVRFYNNTHLPVVIDTWVSWTNHLISTEIGEMEERVIESSVDEWHIHCMFSNYHKEKRQIWKDNKLDYITNIGKFRCSPCASGNYSWLDYNIFICEYSYNSQDEIKNSITFSLAEQSGIHPLK